MTDFKIGDKVTFWTTNNRTKKRVRRIGIYKGRTYSGKAEVMTGYGTEAFIHKLNYSKIKPLNSPKPLLELEEKNE